MIQHLGCSLTGKTDNSSVHSFGNGFNVQTCSLACDRFSFFLLQNNDACFCTTEIMHKVECSGINDAIALYHHIDRVYSNSLPVINRREYLQDPNTMRDSKEFFTMNGPIGLTSQECLTRQWQVPAASTPLNSSAVGFLFSMRVWLVGSWPRRNRNFDLNVILNGERVWHLGDDVVCSKLGKWKGVNRNRFQLLSLNLGDPWCYVVVKHRVAVTYPLFNIRICRSGTDQQKLFVGVSDEHVDHTNSRFMYQNSIINPTFSARSQVFQIHPKASAFQVEYLVTMRVCSDTAACGPFHFASSAHWNENSLTHLEVQNSVSGGVTLIVQTDKQQGPAINSVVVRWVQCEATASVCTSNNAYTKTFPISGGCVSKTFSLLLVDSAYLATKFSVELCNVHFDCTHLITNWNTNMQHWAQHDNVDSAIFQLNSNLKITFPSIATNDKYALPTHREISWWSDYDSSTVEDTLGEWVGCFSLLSGEQQMEHFQYMSSADTVIGCSVECSAAGFVFASLNQMTDGSSCCACSVKHPRLFAPTRLSIPLLCGAACPGEANVLPTYYSGTITFAAVYRVAVVEKRWSQHSGLQQLVKPSILPQQATVRTVQCEMDFGYVMYSKENAKLRFESTSEHLVCVYFDIARNTWHFLNSDDDQGTFSPKRSDFLVARVSPKGIFIKETSEQSPMYATDRLLDRFGIANKQDFKLTRLNPTELEETGTAFNIYNIPRFYSGKKEISFVSKYTSTERNYLLALQDNNTVLNENFGLLDMPGSLPTQVSSRLCVNRGQYEAICTSPKTGVSSSIFSLPDVPRWDNVDISVVPGRQNVIIKWSPLMNWGDLSLAKTSIVAFEVEIQRVDGTCIALNNKDECLPEGFPDTILNVQNCLLSRSPKSNKIGKPSYSYTDVESDECANAKTKHCYGKLLKTNQLPPCACRGTVCSSAALSANFGLDYEIMLGDLFENTNYKFRSRAVVYRRVAFSSRSVLVGTAMKHSAWTTWSSPIFVGSGSPPDQPPHPEVLRPRITSIEFRIWRT